MAGAVVRRWWLMNLAARRGAARATWAGQELTANKSDYCSTQNLSRGWGQVTVGGCPLPWLHSLPQLHRMSCCAGVDAPRAPEVIVEYDEGQADNNDYFIRLADDIEDRFPHLSVLGNPEEVQPRAGSFEVSRDGQILFSMLQAKRRPTVEEVIRAIENLQAKCELTSNTSAASVIDNPPTNLGVDLHVQKCGEVR